MVGGGASWCLPCKRCGCIKRIHELEGLNTIISSIGCFMNRYQGCI